jgi:hypothetical protein
MSKIPHRIFRVDEREWEVFEVKPGPCDRRSPSVELADAPEHDERRHRSEQRWFIPEDLCGGWLAFYSGADRRRLWPAPIGWCELSDDELGVLVSRASATLIELDWHPHDGHPPRNHDHPGRA